MKANEVKGNLNEQRGKLEQKFAILTENDQMFEQGRKKEVLGKTQSRFSQTKVDLRRILSTL